MTSLQRKLLLGMLGAIFSFFLVFLTALSLTRYNSLQTFYYDFGIFARIIWKLSRFQAPIINHLALGDVFFLGDHFNPSLSILAPLFWLTSDLKVLLFEQTLVAVLSSVLVFLIARKVKLSFLPSLVSSLAFLFFAGTANPLVTDWHPESTAGFFLLLFFYFFSFTKKRWVYYLSALIFLGFKESNTFTFIFLLFWLFFIKKDKRKEIIGFFFFSLVWFMLSTRILIPFFSQKEYLYSPELPHSIPEIISSFFNKPQKIKLITDSFVSFGFLPIFSLVGIFPILGELAIRLVPTNSFFQNYTLAFHYSVYLGIFLGLSTIYGIVSVKQIGSRFFAKLPKKSVQKRILFVELFLAVYLLLSSLYVARKVTNAPINLAINPVFWQEVRQQKEFLKVAKTIPRDGSVMAQNNLLSYLVAREEPAYLLSKSYTTYNPDIVVIDLTPGQNPNNFYGSSEEAAKKTVLQLENDPLYKKDKNSSDYLFIFYKK